MKATAAMFLALLTISVAEAQTNNTSDSNAIKVALVDLHSNDGEVRCALYSSADGFPDIFTKGRLLLRVSPLTITPGRGVRLCRRSAA